MHVVSVCVKWDSRVHVLARRVCVCVCVRGLFVFVTWHRHHHHRRRRHNHQNFTLLSPFLPLLVCRTMSAVWFRYATWVQGQPLDPSLFDEAFTPKPSVVDWHRLAKDARKAAVTPTTFKAAFTPRPSVQPRAKRTYLSGAKKRKKKTEGLESSGQKEACVHTCTPLSDVRAPTHVSSYGRTMVS